MPHLTCLILCCAGQLALLQIMAQIGSFVPAQYACFSIVDQVFTRLTSGDCPETNSSTFMFDCEEVNLA